MIVRFSRNLFWKVGADVPEKNWNGSQDLPAKK
jgi:hypothetical protein